MYVAQVSNNGATQYMGGDVENGHITARLKQFGSFALMIDTLQPVIKPVYAYDGQNLSGYKILRFQILDQQTGIKDYDAYLDGKWALFEYDKKNNTIIHTFDDSRFEFGKKHILKIRVVDNRDNETWYECNFYK